jgi:hypothetical protein
MAKQSTNSPDQNIVTNKYFVPEYGVTVEAKSLDEAIKLAAKEVNKES